MSHTDKRLKDGSCAGVFEVQTEQWFRACKHSRLGIDPSFGCRPTFPIHEAFASVQRQSKDSCIGKCTVGCTGLISIDLDGTDSCTAAQQIFYELNLYSCIVIRSAVCKLSHMIVTGRIQSTMAVEIAICH